MTVLLINRRKHVAKYLVRFHCISRHSPLSSKSSQNEPVYKKDCNVASILEVTICGLLLIFDKRNVKWLLKVKMLEWEEHLTENSFCDVSPVVACREGRAAAG